MKKNRLFTPGPTMVPEEVMLEMARPIEHHRTAFYRRMHEEVCDGLQYLFQTKGRCLVFTGSGTAAMEGVIVGCCPPGHKALVVRNGKFAERWAKVCQVFGIDHTPLDLEWGCGAKAEDIRKAMDADPRIDTVIVVHSETSTAAGSDVESIARLTRERGALLLVDGITAVGAIPVKMDEWGVDAYVTGSQKALTLPPGLGLAAVGDRAWERVEEGGSNPALYCDLKAYRKSLETWDAPYTPAVTLVRGLRLVLGRMRERGLESIWKETAMLAGATRAAAQAMGLQLFARDPVDSVTALRVPEGVDEARLRKDLKERFGFHVAGGQADLKGRIIRLSHMGYVDAFDTLGAVAALEIALADQGFPLESGAGVAAAQARLAEGLRARS
ncbi:MAG: alanine--glyoxylate aminotransferase family protein [Planctomycetota bacterium]|nr:MAG: alanine--glyoxylate aminotransferase family protein [Planctomycetota bacterium]